MPFSALLSYLFLVRQNAFTTHMSRRWPRDTIERCMHSRCRIRVKCRTAGLRDGASCTIMQAWRKWHDAVDTFVADGSDGDLLFCF
jgi:hypothetical protein